MASSWTSSDSDTINDQASVNENYIFDEKKSPLHGGETELQFSPYSPEVENFRKRPFESMDQDSVAKKRAMLHKMNLVCKRNGTSSNPNINMNSSLNEIEEEYRLYKAEGNIRTHSAWVKYGLIGFGMFVTSMSKRFDSVDRYLNGFDDTWRKRLDEPDACEAIDEICELYFAETDLHPVVRLAFIFIIAMISHAQQVGKLKN